MSVYVSGCVWKHSQSKGSDRLVLLAIADIAGDDGVALPIWDTSIKTLAAKTMLSERGVQYCIRNLQTIGELAILAPGGRYRANTYQVLLDRNHSLFEGPADIQKNRDKYGENTTAPAPSPVDKSVDKPGPWVQPAAPHGCKPAQERVQPVAPDPSTRLSRQGVSRARENRPPKTKPTLPPLIAAWLEAGITDQVRWWAKAKGYEPLLEQHFEAFRDYMAQERNWKRYTDLDAAFRTCIRDDWGDIRMQAERKARIDKLQPGAADSTRPKVCSYCPRPWTSTSGSFRACNELQHVEWARTGYIPPKSPPMESANA